MDSDKYSKLFSTDLLIHDMRRDRSVAAATGRVGPSSLTCRERVRRTMLGHEFTDKVTATSALIGTYIHTGITAARKELNPRLVHDLEIKIKLNKLEMTGTADEIDLDENSVTDYKTVNDLAYRKRVGPDDAHLRQVHLYALGLIQAGMLKNPPTVRLVYVDRSGKTDEVWTYQQTYDPNQIIWIEEWLADVDYAIQNKEEASKDWPITMCRRFCPYYSACRPDDVPGLAITVPEVAQAANTYHEAHLQETEAKQIKDGAKELLRSVEGMTREGVTVRWLTVNSDNGPYERIEVKKVKGGE
jgi:hypothetical protein